MLDKEVVLVGYSGHGLAITTMVGKKLAETITNQNNNLSLFEKFRHKNFPGFGVIFPGKSGKIGNCSLSGQIFPESREHKIFPREPGMHKYTSGIAGN